MSEDDVQAEARRLARLDGFNPDEIVHCGDPQPVVSDRGDGVPVISMRRPLRPRWSAYVKQARARLEGGEGDEGREGDAGPPS